MNSNTPNTPNPQSAFMPQKEDEIDLKVLLFNCLKYWYWIAICMFLGVLSAYLFNRYSINVYKVESTVLVVDNKPSLGTDLFESSGLGLLQGKSNIEDEIGILKSFSLAEESVQELNMNVQYFEEGFLRISQVYLNTPVLISVDWSKPHLVGGMFRIEILNEDTFGLIIEDARFGVFNPADPYYKTSPREEIKLKKSVFSFGELISGEDYSFVINQVSGLPGDMLLFNFMDTPSLALKFRAALAVSPINKQASILSLSLETPIRKLGEDYINKVMETYLARELIEKNRASESTIQFIEYQLTGISDSLSFSENKLQKYRTQNQVFNLSEEGSVIFERLQELESAKGQTQINLKYYQTLQTYLANNQNTDLLVPSITGVTDPLLNSLVQMLSTLQAENSRLTSNFSDQAPVVRENITRIQNTKNALRENVNSAIRNTENVVADLNGQIRTLEQGINSLPETERKLLGIQRQFSINENIYIYLLQKKAEAEITKAANMPKNSILDFAKAGQSPVAPNRSLNLLIGLMLGLIIPVAFITIKDFLNTKIEDPKELENQIKVPLIGMIGRNTSETALPVLTNSRSSVTESFRSLRADMSYLSPNKGNITILFTSAVSGEGKTFVSVNVASVYALMGKKTILIGVDLRKPKIAEDFNLTNDKGISTCLSSDTPWQDVVKASGYDHLDVMLSGPVPPNPAELLLQEKFGQIIREIKEVYDVVIFDCPPVGLVSETKELFAFSDINFFVFRQGLSLKGNSGVLNNLVEKGGVSKIYALLNDVHIDKGYGYDYGYGYGYGYNSSGYYEEVQLPWWKRALKRKYKSKPKLPTDTNKDQS